MIEGDKKKLMILEKHLNCLYFASFVMEIRFLCLFVESFDGRLMLFLMIVSGK